MDHKAISDQVLVEHEMLMHVTNALRTILDWKSRDYDLSRQLSSLRFTSGSFQRHLERLMALEEHDGYMEVVVKSHPQLAKDVEALRKEHDEFRRSLNRTLHRLDRVAPTDRAMFNSVCDELLALLEKVDKHSAKETDLLQEAFLRDEGAQD